MAKFLNAKRYGMTNAVHFSVDEAFYARLTAAAFSHSGLAELVKQFKAALDDEDKYLQLSRKSDYSGEISDADEARDALYMTLKRVVAAWSESGMEPQADAAKALQKVIDTYKIDARSQLDEETGRLTNLITDMTTEENAAHLTTLGLADTVAKMKEENEQVKTLLASRADERAKNASGALKQARAECDGLYDEITTLIEGLSVAAEDTAPYETFIAEWNEEIARVKQQAKKKSTAAASKSKAKSAASQPVE